MKRTFVFLLVLSLILAGGVPGARAEASILYVKPVEPGSGDCSSWASACTLQDALTSAVAGAQIWVAGGMYKPGPAGSGRNVTFQLKEGVAIYGGFAGDEHLLTQRNWTTNVVILSGDLNGDDSGFTNNGENSYHVVKGVTGAILDGVTIRGGHANGGDLADQGGGIYNSNSSPMLINVTFNNNSAIFGGGMYNLDNSSPMLTNVIFSGNTASGSAGGMYNMDNSNPTLTNVTFSGNAATSGGGMRNRNSSPTLTNVTFGGNTANSGSGGGMSNTESSPTLTNVTFSGNTASEYGGGMYNQSSNPTVRNSLLWGDSGGEIYNLDSTPTVSFSDVQGGYPGTGNLDADPRLAPLGNYGGEVQTMALLPGSTVIDMASSNCPATDGRGVTRSSPSCDLGAFESQGFTLTKTGGDGQSTIYLIFRQPLCVAVTANSAGEPVDGGIVTFTPPASGPSGTLTVNPARIASGAACASVWANGIDGSYNVTASTSGATSVTFSLTNNHGGSIAYLPILIKLAKVEPGLGGKVTMNGAPAPGIPLDLRFYNGSSWSTRASTTTASDGSYNFTNIPTLSPGQSYYVLYLNDSDPSRLTAWWTPEITTYNTASIVIFDTFDIANVELSSPQPGATVSLPVTFSWIPRTATPTDWYEFNLFDPQEYDPWFYTDPPLGYVGSYTLERLPAGFSKGMDYAWSIFVYSPDGGGGMSYYYYIVKFK